MQRVLTDNILDIIISTNLQGEIVYVSPSSEYILGYEPNEIINQNVLALVHPDDVKNAFDNRKRYSQAKKMDEIRFGFVKRVVNIFGLNH